MRKTLFFGAGAACAFMLGAAIEMPANTMAANAAEANSEPGIGPPLMMGRSLANAPYLSSTGETVPRPGQLPSGGQTGQDRQIHDRNNRLINKGICSNC